MPSGSAVDPILRGGAGLHRCEVCECCMTAGALAQHQNGRKHLRRLMAIANGTLKPGSGSSSSSSGSSDGIDGNRVVAWRRFHHCTDCNLWLYWREKERHENGARHRATVAAAARRLAEQQNGALLPLPTSSGSLSGSVNMMLPSATSLTTLTPNFSSSSLHPMPSISHTRIISGDDAISITTHRSLSSISSMSPHQPLTVAPSTPLESPAVATSSASFSMLPSHSSMPSYHHYDHDSGEQPVMNNNKTSSTSSMSSFLSFVSEYDSSGDNGWSLFSNDFGTSSSSTSASSHPLHPGTIPTTRATSTSLPASPSSIATSVAPTTATVNPLGARSSSAPTSPTLPAATVLAQLASVQPSLVASSAAMGGNNIIVTTPSGQLISLTPAQAAALARQHVRRSASSDSVPVPAPYSTSSSTIAASMTHSSSSSSSSTTGGASRPSAAPRSSSSMMPHSGLWAPPTSQPSSMVAPSSSKSLPVSSGISMSGKPVNTSPPSPPLHPSSASPSAYSWVNSSTIYAPSSSSSSTASYPTTSLSPPPLAAVAPHHRRTVGNGHLVYTQQPAVGRPSNLSQSRLHL